VIAGAGAAGLSVAGMLSARGVDALALERQDQLGMSWARRYDSLRLNTPRLLSTMPRYRMPRRYGRWPSRDHMVEYLRDYARQLGLRVELRTEVQRIDRVDVG
jgi:putative flavoprotein involved in K+ transport